MTSFTHAFHLLGTGLHGALQTIGSNVPVYVAAFLIVLIGAIVGFIAKWIVVLLLRSINLKALAQSYGWHEVFGKGYDAVDLVGEFVRWFFVLVFVVQALNALDVPGVDAAVHGLLGYLPNVFTAVVILGVGGVFAHLAGRLVEVVARTVTSTHGGMLGVFTRTAIWVVLVLTALAQLGLSQTYINDLFYAVVVTLVLAFGLGSKDAAAGVVDRLMRKTR